MVLLISAYFNGQEVIRVLATTATAVMDLTGCKKDNGVRKA